LFRLLYGIVELILTAKEQEERARQAPEGGDILLDLGN